MPARAEINVTPMMDVMLVVLMIFMVAVPAINAAVDLPTAVNADPKPPEEHEIVLRIDRTGKYTLERPDAWGSTWPWQEQPATLEDLRQELRKIYHQRTKDRVLYLKADTELRFGVIQHVVEVARASGVRVVATIAQRRGEAPAF